MKAKTIEEKIFSDGLIAGAKENFIQHDTKQRIEMIKEYAQSKVEKENSRLHDRFVDIVPVGYFISIAEYLEMKDLIFDAK